MPEFLARLTYPFHIWQAAEEASGALRTQGRPAWVSLGHGFQHHLVEGLGDERGRQLPKIILEDACGQRGSSPVKVPWLLKPEESLGLTSGSEKEAGIRSENKIKQERGGLPGASRPAWR